VPALFAGATVLACKRRDGRLGQYSRTVTDSQDIDTIRQDTIDHAVAAFIDLPDIVALILLYHLADQWMLGKRIGTPR
jgi:hypothetical protein